MHGSEQQQPVFSVQGEGGLGMFCFRREGLWSRCRSCQQVLKSETSLSDGPIQGAEDLPLAWAREEMKAGWGQELAVFRASPTSVTMHSRVGGKEEPLGSFLNLRNQLSQCPLHHSQWGLEVSDGTL